MREPLTEAEKDYIEEQKRAGKTLESIAEDLNCSYWTARKWWRIRRDGKETAPRGRPPTGPLGTYPDEVREKAVELKKEHHGWGPAKVRMELKPELDLTEDELPSQSRLAALFKEECPEAVKTYQRQQYPEESPEQATSSHEVWQVDGKEKIEVGEEDTATALDIRDPYTGVMIESQAFITTTSKAWRKLDLCEIQNVLRQSFATWGVPEIIQTDREVVYIGSPERCFPSKFTLWLKGLGIEHRVIRAHRPTDQASVERQHRTLGDWVWNDSKFEAIKPLQDKLNETRSRYNEEFPTQAAGCQGEPPLEAYPEARHSGHPFHPALEENFFRMERVDAYLAQQVWKRKVSENGTVSVASENYSVGREHAGQTVAVTFQADNRCFRFESADGELLDELPAIGLDKTDLIRHQPAQEEKPSLTEPFQLPLRMAAG
jgi:transposase InsO family protein